MRRGSRPALNRGWGGGQQTSAAQGEVGCEPQPNMLQLLRRESRPGRADPAGGGLRHHEAGAARPLQSRQSRRAAAGNTRTLTERPALPPLPLPQCRAAVHSLHARWAAEEAAMRRSQPDFDLKAELKNPEMRRLMQLPGMRVQDAYRLAHYEDAPVHHRHRSWSRG